jgi:hypothetical protein
VELFIVLEPDPSRMFLSLRIGGFEVLSSGALGDRIFNCPYDLKWGSLWIDEIRHGGLGSSRSRGLHNFTSSVLAKLKIGENTPNPLLSRNSK